ncbi:hypothetical protein [Spirillospora sp. CA-294931]|uniref:hypothetical protein n=1 Tax=Spirillospora sp. CA-294931 TaxID=3240042 RepID=UPI003D8BCBC2
MTPRGKPLTVPIIVTLISGAFLAALVWMVGTVVYTSAGGGRTGRVNVTECEHRGKGSYYDDCRGDLTLDGGGRPRAHVEVDGLSVDDEGRRVSVRVTPDGRVYASGGWYVAQTLCLLFLPGLFFVAGAGTLVARIVEGPPKRPEFLDAGPEPREVKSRYLPEE